MKTLGLTLILSTLVWAHPSSAQPSLAEHQVKALFLFNFTRYVDWPDEAFESETAPFIIGVIGEDSFDGELNRIVRERKVNDREIVIRNVAGIDKIPGCHILYVSFSERSRRDEIFEATEGLPVLTVGEGRRFLQQGGGGQFLTTGGNVRLAIHRLNAERNGLVLSSQLLGVAEQVISE